MKHFNTMFKLLKHGINRVGAKVRVSKPDAEPAKKESREARAGSEPH